MDLPTVMTEQQFASLVEREHERVELKNGLGRKPLQQTMVAFSNTAGGIIFVGVRDDRTVLGRRRDQGVDDDVHGAAREAHDVGRYEIRELSVGGRPVVAVVVQQRREGFAQTSDGRTLVRRGGHNVALIGADLHDLTARSLRVRFEATDSGIRKSEIDETSLARLVRAHRWRPDTTQDDRLIERGLLLQNGNLTVAGALLLTDPAKSMGASKYVIDVRGYESDSATSYVRRESVGGPLDQQIEGAVAAVLRDLGVDMVVTGPSRQDLPRLPPGAVREAIANAVAHRSYELDRSTIVVEVRPGRLVVTSPGSLPEPVTVATMRDAQAPRNPHVIDVLRKLGLAEDAGRGIDLIEDSLRDDFLPNPVFEETASVVTARLPTLRLITLEERAWLEFYRLGMQVSADEGLILAYLARHGPSGNADVRAVLGVDSTHVRPMLQRLRSLGLVRQDGQRGGALYQLARFAPSATDERLVLELARRGPISNADVRAALGVQRLRALSLLQGMMSSGSLVSSGTKRGTRYRLAEPDGGQRKE